MYFDPVETGKRIAVLRTSRKMTQSQLADKLNISRPHLAKVETGAKTPSLDLMIEIAEFMNVSLDYLVLGKKLPMDEVRIEMNSLIAKLSAIEREF